MMGTSLPEILTTALFLGMLSAVAVTDCKTMRIPNRYNLLLALIGVVSIFTIPRISVTDRIAGMCVTSIPLWIITCIVPGAFGGGDIKLTGACGLFLGWRNSALALFLAVMAGGLYGFYLLAVKHRSRKTQFAFGPFLCFGMVVALFWGEKLVCWYLKFYGL